MWERDTRETEVAWTWKGGQPARGNPEEVREPQSQYQRETKPEGGGQGEAKEASETVPETVLGGGGEKKLVHAIVGTRKRASMLSAVSISVLRLAASPSIRPPPPPPLDATRDPAGPTKRKQVAAFSASTRHFLALPLHVRHFVLLPSILTTVLLRLPCWLSLLRNDWDSIDSKRCTMYVERKIATHCSLSLAHVRMLYDRLNTELAILL